MKKTHAIANQLLHHPSTIVITLLSTMVAIMLSYNIIMRYGISWHVFSTIFDIVPLCGGVYIQFTQVCDVTFSHILTSILSKNI